MCASCGCGGEGRGPEQIHGPVREHVRGPHGSHGPHGPHDPHDHDDQDDHGRHDHGPHDPHHDDGHGHMGDHAHGHGEDAHDPAHDASRPPVLSGRIDARAARLDREPLRARRRRIALETALLAENDRFAARNREWLRRRGVAAFNLMGGPGAGKTALLQRTLRDLGDELFACVVEGDQATSLDAERIRKTGRPVLQLNTGKGCHLDARRVATALEILSPPAGSLLFIENVGNLVCPALFDLGEAARIVLLSLPEGEDKPLKYPHMFRTADLVVFGKIDLEPFVPFDRGRALAHLRRTNPRAEVVAVSATRGDGLDAWYRWLRAAAARAVGTRAG